MSTQATSADVDRFLAETKSPGRLPSRQRRAVCLDDFEPDGVLHAASLLHVYGDRLSCVYLPGEKCTPAVKAVKVCLLSSYTKHAVRRPIVELTDSVSVSEAAVALGTSVDVDAAEGLDLYISCPTRGRLLVILEALSGFTDVNKCQMYVYLGNFNATGGNQGGRYPTLIQDLADVALTRPDMPPPVVLDRFSFYHQGDKPLTGETLTASMTSVVAFGRIAEPRRALWRSLCGLFNRELMSPARLFKKAELLAPGDRQRLTELFAEAHDEASYDAYIEAVKQVHAKTGVPGAYLSRSALVQHKAELEASGKPYVKHIRAGMLTWDLLLTDGATADVFLNYVLTWAHQHPQMVRAQKGCIKVGAQGFVEFSPSQVAGGLPVSRVIPTASCDNALFNDQFCRWVNHLALFALVPVFG